MSLISWSILPKVLAVLELSSRISYLSVCSSACMFNILLLKLLKPPDQLSSNLGWTFTVLKRFRFEYPFPATHHYCCLLSHLLMKFCCLYCKQFGTRSDCSLMRSLIRIHSVCYHNERLLECIWDIKSRRHFQNKRLTLKVPIMTAADDKFCNIFPNFQQK